jgi:hypothetical protein
MVMHACNPRELEDAGWRITSLKPAQSKVVKPYINNKIKMKGLRA